MTRSAPRLPKLALALVVLAPACTTAASGALGSGSVGPTGTPSFTETASATATATIPPKLDGFDNIQHVVFVVQENRSFDHYFGTFPGADGIPMRNGKPTVCIPDPVLG